MKLGCSGTLWPHTSGSLWVLVILISGCASTGRTVPSTLPTRAGYASHEVHQDRGDGDAGLLASVSPRALGADPSGRAAEPTDSSVGFDDETQAQSASAQNSTTTSPPQAGRLMTYEGDFHLIVPNVADAVTRLLQEVKDRGGYLQQRRDGFLTFRVPAAQFEPLTRLLPGFGIVQVESVQAHDVTKQHFDLELRIRTQEQALQRLTQLLERAERVEDVLQIEREIARLTEEIERLKGELQFLASQIAYSTLHVTFHSSAPPPSPPGRRMRSRFEWIHYVGIEQILGRF